MSDLMSPHVAARVMESAREMVKHDMQRVASGGNPEERLRAFAVLEALEENERLRKRMAGFDHIESATFWALYFALVGEENANREVVPSLKPDTALLRILGAWLHAIDRYGAYFESWDDSGAEIKPHGAETRLGELREQHRTLRED